MNGTASAAIMTVNLKADYNARRQDTVQF